MLTTYEFQMKHTHNRRVIGDYKVGMDEFSVHSNVVKSNYSARTKLNRNLEIGGPHRWHLTNKI